MNKGLKRVPNKDANTGVKFVHWIVLLVTIVALFTIALSGCSAGTNDASSASGATTTQVEGENSGGFVAEASSTVTIDIQE